MHGAPLCIYKVPGTGTQPCIVRNSGVCCAPTLAAITLESSGAIFSELRAMGLVTPKTCICGHGTGELCILTA